MILEALANDSEVRNFLSGADHAPDPDAALKSETSFLEERAIQYLKRIDEMLAAGHASLLTPDQVISALRLKSNALQG
jgi:hypothetical protein